MPLIYINYFNFDDCCNSGVNGQVTLSLNAGHQRGRGMWSFMCLELIMQGFITGFHGSRHHTWCIYNDRIIGTDKTNLEKRIIGTDKTN
jgi:hypothetical protein